ncbi:hypothetical protein BVC80_209g264 [Macleaya cordata]|uniref:Oxidative stress 3 n=1 Tax=Macleaya cordata TaxID=56857 RepID=A0A200QDG3_MACCD|nr:hypothetical protein BVC80_209g264 [Macleaya cordata]
MGEMIKNNQNFRDLISTNTGMSNVFPMVGVRNDQWVVMDDGDEVSESVSTTSSFEEDSSMSIGSSSSLDLLEDASSSSCSSFESSSSLQFSKGPLYELSELMNQLPIKRGLSKHFQGKSQSFTSLSNVKCLEDLAKKENPYRKKMKQCKSYAGGLDNTQKSYTPKTCSKIISKKASNKGSLSSLLGKRSGFINGGLSPPILE